jgi:hypothetical protein
MPATRRRRAAAPKVGSGPDTATPLENSIKQEVTARMKQRLGLAESERVPTEIQEIVDSAAREVAESSIAIAVIREVEDAAKRLGRLPIDAGHREQAATTISNLPLLQEAEYLAAKKKALQATGFSSEEAMRILVAEVAHGGSETQGSSVGSSAGRATGRA